MSEPINTIFEDYLAQNADKNPISFEALLKKHPEHKDLLQKKIKAYEKIVGTLSDQDEKKPSPKLGRIIGGCTLIKILGQGGMGIVYLARQEKLNRDVVVKVLRPFAVDNQALKERFLRESRIIGRLNHKNIVPIYDVGEDSGSFYIIMKYLEGLPLSLLIQKLSGIDRASLKMPDIFSILGSQGEAIKHFKAPTEFFCALMIQIAGAVQYAHDNGVIHRDIKPSNIIVEPDGNPVLLDFGLSHDEVESNLTLSGDFLGTPIYSAPELFTKGAVKENRLLDVYSLGVTLYELMTGGLPYEGDSIYEIYSSIKNKEPARPKSKWKGIPRDLETIISTAISKASTFRYQSISHLQADLDHFLRYEPITAKSPSSVQRLVYFAKRKKKWISVAAICLIVAGVASGGYYYRQFQKAKQLQIEVTSLLHKSQIDEAIRKLKEATSSSYLSNKEDLWFSLGQLQGATGNYDESIKNVSKALSLRDKPEYYNILGMMQLYAGNMPASESNYSKGLTKYPENSELLAGMATFEIMKGNLEQAITYAKKAYALKDKDGALNTDAKALFQFINPWEAILANLFIKLGYPNIAENYIRLGLQAMPFNPCLLRTLQQLSHSKSDQDAIKAIATKIGPEKLHIHGDPVKVVIPFGWLRTSAQQAFGQGVLAFYYGPPIAPEENYILPTILVSRVAKDGSGLDQQATYFLGQIIRRFKATTFQNQTEAINNHPFKKFLYIAT